MISPDEGTRRLELGSDAGFLMLMTVLIVGAWVGWSALPPMDHGAAAPAPAMAGRVPGAPVAAASPTGPSDRPTVRATVRPGMIRVATAIDILAEESPWFSPEADASLFAAAAVQIAAAIVLGTPDDDPERQLEIHAAAMDATTPDESRDGSVGPEAMARVLSDLTGQPFVLVIRPTRQDALRVAARANSVGAPAILLTWRGAPG